MLPLLRILPVGGVLFAILLLALTLNVRDDQASLLLAGDGTRSHRNEDPPWRQVAIQAALLRASELVRLRDLPDTPVQRVVLVSASEPEPMVQVPVAVDEPIKLAALPIDRPDADPDPDDVTNSIDDGPAATIPVEIGAASSSELPVVLPEERPAIIRTPERARPAHESRRRKPSRLARRKPPAARPEVAPQAAIGLFDAQSAYASANAVLNQTPAHRADSAGY